MTALIDTHVLLWWLESESQLPEAAQATITGPSSSPVVSASVIWEIAIKRELGKLRAPANLLHLLSNQRVPMLNITPEHADLAGSLPPHHRDPFDRMLIAQAIVEGLPVVTADAEFSRYEVETLWS